MDDENLVSDFDETRKKCHDPTISAGIRRAMQDFIYKYQHIPSEN